MDQHLLDAIIKKIDDKEQQEIFELICLVSEFQKSLKELRTYLKSSQNSDSSKFIETAMTIYRLESEIDSMATMFFKIAKSLDIDPFNQSQVYKTSIL